MRSQCHVLGSILPRGTGYPELLGSRSRQLVIVGSEAFCQHPLLVWASGYSSQGEGRKAHEWAYDEGRRTTLGEEGQQDKACCAPVLTTHVP